MAISQFFCEGEIINKCLSNELILKMAKSQIQKLENMMDKKNYTPINYRILISVSAMKHIHKAPEYNHFGDK